MAFSTLHQVIHKLDQRKPWQPRQEFQRILDCWSEVVGPAVAAHARPLAIQRQVLKVATSSPVWAQNLAFQRCQILKKLNDRLSGQSLTDIRFSTAQWQGDRPDSPSPSQAYIDQLWREHPSRSTSRPIRSPGGDSLPLDAADANAVFQRWAAAVQGRSRRFPLCPSCQCPTPTGELERWSVCALCAARQWHT
ncbi:MAG: DUF721 domain-containing protein [Synechococcales bacterium]|nr:DUF721 domain-containing protein [Synechococcales bacterium]